MTIGVMYDGGWWAYVNDFYAHSHPWSSNISFQGFHDLLRLRYGGGDVQAHYVRGRSETPSTSFDKTLEVAGVVRHDASLSSGGEKGADVELALTAYENALSVPWDVVVLVTGDADFVPLARRLVDRGKKVVVPLLNVRREEFLLVTSPRLTQTASEAPPMEEILADGLKDGYRGIYPFVSPAADRRPRTESGRMPGTITRWRAGDISGFLTDSQGRSWFISRNSLPEGLESLSVGTQVTFNGRPHPRPGKRYPEAFSVVPEEWS